MSRVGRRAIVVPEGVAVKLKDQKVFVKGPHGEKEILLPITMTVTITGKEVTVARATDDRSDRALHGLIRNEIYNAIVGTTEGYQKVLEITGVGYKAAVAGRNVTLNLGFSHPILFELPKGIDASVEKQTVLSIKGSDKYLVGQVASKIKAFRKPEPYKGKGIKYKDEQIIRKEGKSGKK
ncbi:MAG: 50S ribosomal protein L6 [Nitrospirae bacterium]|nr:50S ribosomal protein L6 [Candidatus Troglogloeales bacterium]